MATCRSCNAPIRWARTVNDKAIPLDAQPTTLGNLELRGQVAHHVTPDHNALGTRYTSHFATCKNAAQHRKAKR
jgi:hypothetical protein